MNILSKFQLSSSSGVGLTVLWIYFHKPWVSELINYKAVYRTALATLGLSSLQCTIQCTLQCTLQCSLNCLLHCSLHCTANCPAQCILHYTLQYYYIVMCAIPGSGGMQVPCVVEGSLLFQGLFGGILNGPKRSQRTINKEHLQGDCTKERVWCYGFHKEFFSQTF